ARPRALCHATRSRRSALAAALARAIRRTRGTLAPRATGLLGRRAPNPWASRYITSVRIPKDKRPPSPKAETAPKGETAAKGETAPVKEQAGAAQAASTSSSSKSAASSKSGEAAEKVDVDAALHEELSGRKATAAHLKAIVE